MRSECVAPSVRDRVGGELTLLEHPGAHRVVDVVVDVGDAIGEAHELGLEGRRHRRGPRVVHDAVAHLPREVEPGTVVLEVLDDAQRLLVVAERPPEEGRERLLAEVAEGRVAQVVAERDGLGEVLVEAQGARARAGDLRDVERMGEPHTVVVALGRQEHLGLVLAAAGTPWRARCGRGHAGRRCGCGRGARRGRGPWSRRPAPRGATTPRVRAARFALGGWTRRSPIHGSRGGRRARSVGRRPANVSERRGRSRSDPRRCGEPRSPSRLPR